MWRFYRRKCRYKGVERVLEEIEAVQEDNVFITDDSFFSDVRRASQIAAGLRDRQIRKSYVVQACSDTIAHHPELIALWREAGLRSAFVGLEKIDARGLKRLHKHNSIENNEKALQVLHRNRIGVMASLIVDPDYERGDFAALSSYARKHRLDMLSFTILTPLPGTSLFE